MLVLLCPHCGPRNSSEFTYQGEISQRPGPTVDRVEWRRFLYEETNTADWMSEQWFHGMGCRRFLRVERHTVSNDVRSVRDLADD